MREPSLWVGPIWHWRMPDLLLDWIHDIYLLNHYIKLPVCQWGVPCTTSLPESLQRSVVALWNLKFPFLNCFQSLGRTCTTLSMSLSTGGASALAGPASGPGCGQLQNSQWQCALWQILPLWILRLTIESRFLSWPAPLAVSHYVIDTIRLRQFPFLFAFGVPASHCVSNTRSNILRFY